MAFCLHEMISTVDWLDGLGVRDSGVPLRGVLLDVVKQDLPVSHVECIIYYILSLINGRREPPPTGAVQANPPLHKIISPQSRL